VQRVAVIGTLRPESAGRAAELLSKGPPFDPRAVGFERHTVFLGEEEVVFVFEGGSLEPLAELLTGDRGAAVVGAWESVLDGMPRVAREVFSWTRPADVYAPGLEE
jgi:hypothetical protein